MSTPLNISSVAQLVDLSIQEIFMYPSADRNEQGRVRNSREYDEYNRLRAEKYAREERSYQIKKTLLAVAFWGCIIALIFQLIK